MIVEVVLIGHTDTVGKAENNLALWKQRTEVVADRLQASGLIQGFMQSHLGYRFARLCTGEVSDSRGPVPEPSDHERATLART